MSAVAMLAAASCNKPELENIDKAPELGAKEFVAYTEAPTKTQLNGLATEWEEGDVIDINGVSFVTNETGTKVIFKIEDDNSEFPEAPYLAGYPYSNVMASEGTAIDFAYLNEGNELTLTRNQIGDEVFAMAYSESEPSLEFKNVLSLIKFQVPSTFTEEITRITISTNEPLAGYFTAEYNNGKPTWEISEGDASVKEIILKDEQGTFSSEAIYFVPVLPGAKTNLTVKINDKIVATGISIQLDRNVIHNIAVLPAEAKKIYLKPNVWNSDNAWFSAHFWNDKGLQVDSRMEDTDQDGIYEVIAPNGATGVSFCRMNPKFEEFGWNPENVTEENKRVWNQSSDLEIPTNDKLYYVVNGWDTGAWKTYEEATAPPVIGLVGSLQGWNIADPIAMTDNGDGWIVAKNVELYKTDDFKFVTGNSWDNPNYGGNGGVLVADVDKEYTLSQGGENIKVNNNGKFDLYFNPNTNGFKYSCVEEYTDLMVTITIDNKANWSPLYITLKDGDTVVADNETVTNNKYQISGDYIGSTLTCTLSNGNKTSEKNVAITKNGAIITLEETIIKLKIQLDTNNSKQWWGDTMKIHVWNTQTSFDTTWPGNTMTLEGNYTWSIIVPSELIGKTINYCVHNGNNWQSKDATVTIKAEGNTVTGSSIGIN